MIAKLPQLTMGQSGRQEREKINEIIDRVNALESKK